MFDISSYRHVCAMVWENWETGGGGGSVVPERLSVVAKKIELISACAKRSD